MEAPMNKNLRKNGEDTAALRKAAGKPEGQMSYNTDQQLPLLQGDGSGDGIPLPPQQSWAPSPSEYRMPRDICSLPLSKMVVQSRSVSQSVWRAWLREHHFDPDRQIRVCIGWPFPVLCVSIDWLFRWSLQGCV